MKPGRTDDTPLPAPLPLSTREQSGRIQLDWIASTGAVTALKDPPRSSVWPLLGCVLLLAASHLPQPSLTRAYEVAAPTAGEVAQVGLTTLRCAYDRARPAAERALSAARDRAAEAAGLATHRFCQRFDDGK